MFILFYHAIKRKHYIFMIRLTPTFLSEYRNATNGLPEGIDTKLSIPTIKPVGKKVTINYGDKSYLKKPSIPG